MNLKEWQLIILTAYLLTLIAIFFPLVSKIMIRSDHDFVSMEILGFNGTTGDYFHNSNSQVNPGDTLQWTISVNNYTPDSRLFHIRARLEKTDYDPLKYITNSDNNTILFEKDFVVNARGVQGIAFNCSMNWDIFDKGLIVINNLPAVTVTNFGAGNYKIKFELMRYDEINMLRPDINVNNEIFYIWNQINFTVS